MGTVLWSIFSRPSIIANSGDTPFMLGGVLIIFVITALFMAIVGKRIMLISGAGAVLAGSVFLPALMVASAIVLAATSPKAPPPNDGPVMLFFALVVLAICALPVSFVTSMVYVKLQRRENVR